MSDDEQCSLCLNNLTNSSVYVAGCELAYRYCLLPGARYLLPVSYTHLTLPTIYSV